MRRAALLQDHARSTAGVQHEARVTTPKPCMARVFLVLVMLGPRFLHQSTNHRHPDLKPVTVACAPLVAVCSLMFQHFVELEILFEDHGVCSDAITDSLVLERAVHEQRTLVQPLLAAVQLVKRQKGAHLLLDLAVTCAFPAHTSAFALQIHHLAHVWSNRESDSLTLTTSLPWLLPSTCTSSCISHRNIQDISFSMWRERPASL